MDKDKKIEWLNIISNIEFQNAVEFKTLKEISMISKLAREKLKPAIFKTIVFFYKNLKFESNVLSIAIEKQFKNSQFNFNLLNLENDELEKIEFDYQDLKEKHSGDIQDSFGEYEFALKDIKKFVKHFQFEKAKTAGYYLYPLINEFVNLTELSINGCNIPFTAFADIGKVVPNLSKLNLCVVNLVKSPTDIIASSDISFPPNLTSLTIIKIQVAATNLLLDPYEYLFNNNTEGYSYERLILPKNPLPLLKHLIYAPSNGSYYIGANLGLEEFLDANSKLESLDIGFYNLKMDSSMRSLKFLRVDDAIHFNTITNDSNFDCINSLHYAFYTFKNTTNFRNLCNLCPNLIDLQLNCFGCRDDSQRFIDNFLTPALPNLTKLKSLKITAIRNDRNPKILDFTKFSQIEKLELYSCGSILNINFIGCKSLKQVNFICSRDKLTEEFMNNLNSHEGWTFNSNSYAVFGNKSDFFELINISN